MLEGREVSVTFGARRVLHHVSVTMKPGVVTALIGPNGAGKSTLLACLSGALRPHHGAVRIDGDEPAHLDPAELGRRRAVLEQTPGSSVPFTVGELAELGIPVQVSPAEARRIVQSATGAVGLSPLIGHRIDRLSGGERHRAHMARTLAQLQAGRFLGGGRWLLLDEPTASLDLVHQSAVLRAARGAAAEGAGVLAVLHDLTLAAAIADTVVLMDRGRTVAAGPVADILTPARLAPVYGIDLAVTHPAPGVRAVIPLYQASKGASPCSSP